MDTQESVPPTAQANFSPSPNTTQPPASKKMSNTIIFWMIGITVLLAAEAGFLYYKNVQLEKRINSMQPTPPLITSPTPIQGSNSSMVTAIQINTCCSCPTKIPSNQIGTDGWVPYQLGKNYSSQLPATCQRVDCKPCPPPEDIGTTTPQTCGGFAGTKCPSGFTCQVTATYPDATGTCVADSQTRTKLSCPPNGYVDCMPNPNAGIKYECTPEAMSWYQANCPDFKGGAM